MKIKPDKEERENTASSIPIVGIGASAGGLAAFQAFFSGMPVNTDPGMSFVVVQHLAPDYKSMLTELVQRYTRMNVFEVTDGLKIKLNYVYIIPPGKDMAILNGYLQLFDPIQPRGSRLAIDFFFKSLAQDQGERAIGIVLSGTGHDGTEGIRAIKAAGGIVMVQKRESAEYDGMVLSAIETGLIDDELLPGEMPNKLIDYVKHAFRKPLKIEAEIEDHLIQKICVIIRYQTGHDFSQYKTNTLRRRINRRMNVHQIDTKDEYLQFLQQSPAEVEVLFQEILIGVTNFFRDPEAFQVLEEKVIPKIFMNRSEDSEIRIWSIGCSTGEEAYSLAILLKETMTILKKNYIVKIFATDIDGQAIAKARAGMFPLSVASDLSPERLARLFSLEADEKSYRIHKNIRDL